MRKFSLAIAFVLSVSQSLSAQPYGPGPVYPTTSNVATAIGVNGAVKSNGSTTFGQAASTDLSDIIPQGTCTWTPSDQSGASLTFTSVSVTCSKIGKDVFFSGQLTYPSTASGANASIGGLPYTSANNAFTNIPCNFVAVGASLVTDLIVNTNATTFVPQLISSATGLTNVQLSTRLVAFNCHYYSAN